MTALAAHNVNLLQGWLSGEPDSWSRSTQTTNEHLPCAIRQSWIRDDTRGNEDRASSLRQAITAALRVANETIETAFAEVPREDFLSPGPWPIFRMRQAYVPTPTADPVYLYTDDIVGIVPERHINNGQPYPPGGRRR
jgi:hypothetical protein